MRNKAHIQNCGRNTSKDRPLGSLGLDGRIILKMIFKK
jgi:hypothetical protein